MGIMEMVELVIHFVLGIAMLIFLFVPKTDIYPYRPSRITVNTFLLVGASLCLLHVAVSIGFIKPLFGA